MFKDPPMVCERRSLLRMAGAGAMVAALSRTAFAAAPPVKIGTIGSGKIGGTLGAVWVKTGHEVMFSSRNPENLKSMAAGLGAKAHVGTVAETIAFADVVLLAIPYHAMPNFSKEFGKALTSKVCVLDATNPREYREKELAIEALKVGAAQYTANLLPGVRIVRCYNAITAVRFGEGGLRADGKRIGMPITGEDPKAIALASELIRETGFEPVLVGGVAMGRYLVPGTPLAGENTPDEIKQIVATLK
jgi:predicted dinucleotide-binding enzyme